MSNTDVMMHRVTPRLFKHHGTIMNEIIQYKLIHQEYSSCFSYRTSKNRVKSPFFDQFSPFLDQKFGTGDTDPENPEIRKRGVRKIGVLLYMYLCVPIATICNSLILIFDKIFTMKMPTLLCF